MLVQQMYSQPAKDTPEMSRKVIAVLPTYNEAENLPLMIEALLALNLPKFHILVVDDNSPDGTGQLAEQFAQQHRDQVSVLHRTEKNGLGPAYKAGVKRAIQEGAEVIVQMDTDFSHPPRYLPGLLAKLDEGYDMIVGSRYARGGGVDESWGIHRKLLSWFANRVYVRTLLNIPVNDATSGFRAWTSDSLIGIDLDRIMANGYVFQVEITYVAHMLGYKMGEVPIYFPDRQRGDSKMDTRIAAEAALAVWQMMQRHRHLTPTMRRQKAYI
jgi:dolichol-phosphate mannosyltransferase